MSLLQSLNSQKAVLLNALRRHFSKSCEQDTLAFSSGYTSCRLFAERCPGAAGAGILRGLSLNFPCPGLFSFMFGFPSRDELFRNALGTYATKYVSCKVTADRYAKFERGKDARTIRSLDGGSRRLLPDFFLLDSEVVDVIDFVFFILS